MDDAAEADVTGRGVDGLRLAGCRPVAQAVARSAEMRTALDDAAGDVLAGTSEIVARIRSLDARVQGRLAAGARDLLGAGDAWRVVVGRPLPDIPGDVVEPEAVGREEPHWRGTPPSLCAGVVPGELAL